MATEPSSSAAAHAVRRVVALLRRDGHRVAAVADLGWPGLGVHVVKVLVPGLALSELL